MYHSSKNMLYGASVWSGILFDERTRPFSKPANDIANAVQNEAGLESEPIDSRREYAEQICREVYGRLYEDCERLSPSQQSAPEWLSKFHELLSGLDEYQALQKTVQGDPDFSALAGSKLLNQITPKLGGLIKEMEAENESQAEQGSGQPSGPAGPSTEDRMRAALRAACRDVGTTVGDAKGTLSSVAPGLASSPPKSEQRDPGRMALIDSLISDEKFKRVAEMAGRSKRLSRNGQKLKIKAPYGAVAGIELGDDITRIDLAHLGRMLDDDPDIALMAEIEFVDGEATQSRMESTIPVGRGPFVYLRDVSSSMGGDPHFWGAVAGVALSSQATSQNRTMISACFNGGVHSARHLSKTGLRLYESSYGGCGLTKLSNPVARGAAACGAAALGHSNDGCHGGTSFDAPMSWALSVLESEPKADIVFLTDGQASLSAAVMGKLENLKAEGLRIYGMTLNGGSATEAVKAICDRVVNIDDPESDLVNMMVSVQ